MRRRGWPRTLQARCRRHRLDETRAVRDGDDWVLNGQKSWITNAGVSEFYTVLAVTDPHGARGSNMSAFIVEKSDAGLTFGEKERKARHQGLTDPRPALRQRADPRQPDDRRTGLEPQARPDYPGSHPVTIGAQAVGSAQGALDFAVGYAKERKQFGKHIADFQGIQLMLADMAVKLEVARQMVYVAAAKSERDDPDRGFFGAAAKCFASDAAMEITTEAVQLLGGNGSPVTSRSSE